MKNLIFLLYSFHIFIKSKLYCYRKILMYKSTAIIMLTYQKTASVSVTKGACQQDELINLIMERHWPQRWAGVLPRTQIFLNELP